jgi:hypothetical protein
MNPNYIKECTRIVGGHNKHENVIAIWNEPNDIGFHLLITKWFKSRPNIGA